ncbi:hypothetical protein [Paenibacillus spongiae]|uniref:DUF2207 domain-containing protein n=1 Tax=Paenibacillus spongiae TaxID=2909671 RepID=A0ABY5S7S1_9BACL|nr:hypothetical protein [Paenibacillus spongiae]UVI29956.1 hypothetical protein L1F29_32005 [Paenibacillus spongiae]
MFKRSLKIAWSGRCSQLLHGMLEADYDKRVINMEALVIIGVIVVIGLIVRSTRRPNRQRTERGNSRSLTSSIGRPSATRQPPAALGVPEGHPARQAAQRLDYALTADFEARVKDRMLRKEPRMSENDWQWRWFELKRYFLMCGVLRNVPMYSAKVDDVWHEMLMFTWEYEQFCKSFSGTFIHHAPHAPGAKPDSAERAWFDWVYGELFAVFPASAQLWGAFYRTPLSRERIEELELAQADELRARRFNGQSAEAYPDLDGTVDYLVKRGRQLAQEARSGVGTAGIHEDRYRDRNMASDSMMATGVLSGALFFSSMGPADEFDRHMDEAQTEVQRQANGGSGGGASGCGGYGDGDRDHGSNGNDGSSCGGSGGSDGGGSSGSSGGDSGGGCSSGCGGGCSS